MIRTCLVLGFLLSGSLHAQDSLYAGRVCDLHLSSLHLPAINDIADSAALIHALHSAGDSAHDTTIVLTLTFRADGSLKSVKASGTPSRDAQRTLENVARTLVRRLPPMAKSATVALQHLHGERRLTLEFFPATCNPDEGSRVEAEAYLLGAAGPHTPKRTAVVGLVLEPTGEISQTWVAEPSGIRRLDSLALVAVRMIRFKPAIVGRTAERAELRVPFNF